ncbi:uncharacterized protein KRP23_3277 [Phytophthora ramorum]|uniref:uncharacterized protein n=1 Tax=Phytophthora ramorum TaxID=164328 RepID=UPI0030A4E030|nr:hypothetical protein KRP23_3277 [Phytophthora ramorum]
MDVPSWHPANRNSDVLRRLATSGGAVPQRTEFKSVSTSTEEEREHVEKHDNVALGGGRGLLDPSDRLYLLEQTRLEQQAESRERMERDTALLTFRSNALKLQARKTSVLDIAVAAVAGGKPSRLSPEKKTMVVVKAKKRRATADKETKAKKPKKTPKKGQTIPGSHARDDRGGKDDCRTSAKALPIETIKKTKDVPSKSPALLLQDYSGSSDEE